MAKRRRRSDVTASGVPVQAILANLGNPLLELPEALIADIASRAARLGAGGALSLTCRTLSKIKLWHARSLRIQLDSQRCDQMFTPRVVAALQSRTTKLALTLEQQRDHNSRRYIRLLTKVMKKLASCAAVESCNLRNTQRPSRSPLKPLRCNPDIAQHFMGCFPGLTSLSLHNYTISCHGLASLLAHPRLSLQLQQLDLSSTTILQQQVQRPKPGAATLATLFHASRLKQLSLLIDNRAEGQDRPLLPNLQPLSSHLTQLCLMQQREDAPCSWQRLELTGYVDSATVTHLPLHSLTQPLVLGELAIHTGQDNHCALVAAAVHSLTQACKVPVRIKALQLSMFVMPDTPAMAAEQLIKLQQLVPVLQALTHCSWGLLGVTHLNLGAADVLTLAPLCQGCTQLEFCHGSVTPSLEFWHQLVQRMPTVTNVVFKHVEESTSLAMHESLQLMAEQPWARWLGICITRPSCSYRLHACWQASPLCQPGKLRGATLRCSPDPDSYRKQRKSSFLPGLLCIQQQGYEECLDEFTAGLQPLAQLQVLTISLTPDLGGLSELLQALPRLHTLQLPGAAVYGQEQLDTLLAATQLSSSKLRSFQRLTKLRADVPCSWQRMEITGYVDCSSAAHLPLHSLTQPLVLAALAICANEGDNCALVAAAVHNLTQACSVPVRIKELWLYMSEDDTAAEQHVELQQLVALKHCSFITVRVSDMNVGAADVLTLAPLCQACTQLKFACGSVTPSLEFWRQLVQLMPTVTHLTFYDSDGSASAAMHKSLQLMADQPWARWLDICIWRPSGSDRLPTCWQASPLTQPGKLRLGEDAAGCHTEAMPGAAGVAWSQGPRILRPEDPLKVLLILLRLTLVPCAPAALSCRKQRKLPSWGHTAPAVIGTGCWGSTCAVELPAWPGQPTIPPSPLIPNQAIGSVKLAGSLSSAAAGQWLAASQSSMVTRT
ncbi:hypothetical protein V8C86DRAFT_3035125 [Haematococcus lacustris]